MTPLTVIHSPLTAHHDRVGHVESAPRARAVLAGLRACGAELAEVEAEPAARAAVTRVHPPAYVERVRVAAEEGRDLDADTYTTPHSLEAALLAAGGACGAVDAVVRGGAAFSAMRPPGHHASPLQAMGFCLLSNAAIAARHAQAEHGAGRIAIVDWDVHHGNGSQDVFWNDPSVLVASLHQWPLWPGSGAESERGGPAARGATRNFCIAPGTAERGYRERWAEALAAVEAFGPELVIVSCGFDAHRSDPLADLELEAASFGRLATDVRRLCRALGAPEPAVLLEGGYAPAALEDSARAVGAALAAPIAD